MANSKEMIKELFFNNWGLKLTAFILALMTFYAIHNATNEERIYKVPVIVTVKEGIAVLDKDPTSVEITFRGSIEDVSRMDPDLLEVRIKPTVTTSAGSEKVPIRKGNVYGAVGVRPVAIVPNVVDLTFDMEDEQQFSVAKPTTIGTPLKGKVEIDYEPKVVNVRGPRQQLQRMIEENVVIETEPIDVDERVKSFTRTLDVISPSETWVSKIEPAEILVTVNIVTESISREWTNLTVFAIMDLEKTIDVQIKPAMVNLSLHGRPDLVKSIISETIKVFVDCSELDAGRAYELPVNVHLPQSISDVTVTVDPDRVKVVLKKREEIDGKEKETN